MLDNLHSTEIDTFNKNHSSRSGNEDVFGVDDVSWNPPGKQSAKRYVYIQFYEINIHSIFDAIMRKSRSGFPIKCLSNSGKVPSQNLEIKCWDCWSGHGSFWPLTKQIRICCFFCKICTIIFRYCSLEIVWIPNLELICLNWMILFTFSIKNSVEILMIKVKLVWNSDSDLAKIIWFFKRILFKKFFDKIFNTLKAKFFLKTLELDEADLESQ